MSFICLVPNFNLKALNLVLALSQLQLFKVDPLLNVEGNSPSPLELPFPSKNLVVLSHTNPVVQFVPPCFCDSSKSSQFFLNFQIFYIPGLAIQVVPCDISWWVTP